MKRYFPLLFLWFFLSFSPAYGEEFENKVQLSLISGSQSIQPGTPFKIGLFMQIEKGWHTYYKDPGDAGAPPTIEWNVPKGYRLGKVQWPEPARLKEPGDIWVNAFKKELLIWREVIPPDEIKKEEARLSVSANWLVCEKVCIPEEGEAFLRLPVRDETPVAINQKLFQKFDSGKKSIGFKTTLKYMLFAFIGGLILNAMPCVLPVISLKVLSFVRMAHEHKSRIFALGVAFVLGVLVCFSVFASLVIFLKDIGSSVGWGFQFQYPGFVVVMTCIVFLLGLSLAGLFELSLSVPQKGVALTQKEGLGGAFFHGILATILATPCTAPFVGVTVGFAFAGSVTTIWLIFLTMGLGLAFPFLLLSLNPAWVRFVPKPGPWMEIFKQSMAFLLFATAVWLLWVVGRQAGVDGMVWTLAYLVCLGLAAWIYGKIQLAPFKKRIVSTLFLIIFLVVSGHYFIGAVVSMPEPSKEIRSDKDGIQWQKYEAGLFQRLLQEGKPVFLDFTADWCLTCKVNEKVVLSQPEVAEKFKTAGIVPLKLDWTNRDPEVTELLNSFGRYGVPLYVYYPKGDQAEPKILPEILTRAGLLKALE